MDYYEDIEDLFDEHTELEESEPAWEFSYSDLLAEIDDLDTVNNNEDS